MFIPAAAQMSKSFLHDRRKKKRSKIPQKPSKYILLPARGVSFVSRSDVRSIAAAISGIFVVWSKITLYTSTSRLCMIYNTGFTLYYYPPRSKK